MHLKLLALSLFATEMALAALPLRLITFNIRYAATSLEAGEKPWWDLFCFISASRCRQPHVVKQISDLASAAPPGAPAVVGLQEVLDSQLNDIKNGLGSSTWAHVGVARDDGARSGEYNPILYRRDQLRVLFSETKWLSPTPDVVSFGWAAGSRRVVTLAVFEHIATGTTFIHANTHLDNVSAQARSEGIKVVLARIKAARQTYGPLGISLTGDFNSVPYADAFKTLADAGFMKSEMFDLASPDRVVGPNRLTYTTFSPNQGGSRLDFIWLGPADGYSFSVQRYEIVSNVVDGMYISDHRAVVGDVTLQG